MTTDWKANSTLQGKVNRVKGKGCGGREGDERRGQRSRGSDAARARKEIVLGKAEGWDSKGPFLLSFLRT